MYIHTSNAQGFRLALKVLVALGSISYRTSCVDRL
jgi:hypothetical protein